MIAVIRIVVAFSILKSTLTEKASPKFIIVGAGAAGISTAAKLLENGYNDIVILEAQNRIGGRVNSIEFGNGYIDLGAQWCHGQTGNVVYELVANDFEFGDLDIRPENSHFYDSDGHLMDQNKCTKIMNLSQNITSDYDNMAFFNGSLGEFFDVYYQMRLQKKEFEDIDKELAEKMMELSGKQMNSLYASETWFDVSAKLNAFGGAEGNQQLTWKGQGYRTVFDFLTKKLPDPSKALTVDEKIHFNKEVTNIDSTASDLNQVVVKCANGSEYRADHVIVTASLGFLKKHHLTLFTPHLPEKKVNAITNTGFGTLGKIFLEFKEPFWPTDPKNWTAYLFLWNQEDKDSITGTEKEWLQDVAAFIKEDEQPNLIGALVAGKNLKHFEEISDNQLIDDCMWLLEKFLGKTLPRPINMRRSRWMTNKYFYGSYSYPSMDTQAHNVVVAKDLAESIYSKDGKPIVLFAGEATDEENSGCVNGAVASGWRAANEIFEYYKTSEQ